LWRNRLNSLDAPELGIAERAGILNTSGWGNEGLTPNQAVWLSEGELDANGVLDVLERLSRQGGATPIDEGGQMAIDHISDTLEMDPTLVEFKTPASIATSFVAKLPSLEHLTIKEVIDLRAELQDYLPAFRAEMIKLSDEISSTSSGEERNARKEIERRWHLEINPILQEIHHEYSTSGFWRKLLDTISTDKGAMTSAASSIVLGVGSMAVSVAGILPALASAAYPAIKSLNESIKSSSELQKNKLYFLYAAQKGVAKRTKKRVKAQRGRTTG
jgi:hypothetical protein